MSTTSPTETSTKLRGRTLFLARLTWVTVAALTLIVFVAAIPAGYAYLPNLFSESALRQLNLPFDVVAAYFIALNIISALGFFAVAAVIFWRRADDWVALLLALSFVTYPSWFIANLGSNQPSPLWLVGFLASFDVGTGLIAFYLFPDGQFVPRWTRWLAPGVGGWALALFLLYPGGILPSGEIGIGQPFSLIFAVGLLIGMGAGVYAQIYRYARVANATQRQQTKWWVFGLTVAFLGQALILLPQMIFPALSLVGLPRTLFTLLIYPVAVFAFLLMPLSLGFSVLRYRLWDVDFVINRSLVYGALTALLIALFGGSLLVVSLVFQKFAGGPLVAVAVSAAISGVIFQPVRARLQRFVDQRFYGIQIEYRPPPSAGTAFTKTHFSTYTDLELVGRGGMAEVYKATHPTLNRPVAIKILPAALAAEAESRKRFLREAQTVAALEHPNIIKVFDYGEEGGMYFMVMEYIAGPSLSSFLRERGRLPWEQALPLIRDIVSALDYAHAQGLVHRDIKPSNVMLDTQSPITNNQSPDPQSQIRAVLTDFGIAKILSGGTHLTRTGMIGTLEYIAPEQIQASANVDARADLYAFGVVVFQMLTGELPFKHGNPGALLLAHLNQPAPDPRAIAPDLPRPVAHALRQALAKSPDDRYRTAREFLAACA